MRTKQRLSRKSQDAIVIILIGLAGGILYPLLSNEYDHPGKIMNGVLIGLFSSSFIVLNEIVFRRGSKAKIKFNTLVGYKSIIYSTFFTVVIVSVVSLQRAYEADESLFEYFTSPTSNFIWNEDLHLIIIYMLVSTTLFIFFYQMSRKMGPGVLWNFITGRYHKAREEERLFMFMDINNSTSLAEQLGDIEYNKLLSNFFFDITESILANYGEIYRYVGDEVVVSWKLKKGLANAHFLRAFFQAKNAIYVNKEKYMNDFGLLPSFSAGFNYGKVIIGEIGEVKSQICFFGKVMYQTPLIEKECKKFGTTNLLPESLIKQIDLPIIFSAKEEGVLELVGEEPVKLYSISEK